MHRALVRIISQHTIHHHLFLPVLAVSASEATTREDGSTSLNQPLLPRNQFAVWHGPVQLQRHEHDACPGHNIHVQFSDEPEFFTPRPPEQGVELGMILPGILCQHRPPRWKVLPTNLVVGGTCPPCLGRQRRSAILISLKFWCPAGRPGCSLVLQGHLWQKNCPV